MVTNQVDIDKRVHVSVAFARQIFCLTADQEIPPIAAPSIREEDVQGVRQKIPINGGSLIAINVNAGEAFLERRWPPIKFATLVARMAENNSEHVFCFIGSHSEFSYVQSVIHLTRCDKRCYNLSGLLSLGELCALLKYCELLISNDSGPLHLAAALNLPAIGLFGPESPRFYGPLGEKIQAVYKGISCSPCMNIYHAKSFKCPYNAKCMDAIDVSEVERAVEQFYTLA